MAQMHMMPQSPQGRLAESLGQAIGGAGGNYLGEQIAYQRNKGRLQQAFEVAQNNPQGDFISKLGQIAPALLSTPGGAQVLAELAPLMQKQGAQQAQLNAIRNQRKGISSEGVAPEAVYGQPKEPTDNRIPEGIPPEEVGFRYPKIPGSPETAYPQRTVGPQPMKEWSPQEIESKVLDLMEQSTLQGTPMDYPTALQTVNMQAQQIRQFNEDINRQKESQDAAQKAITAGVVNRAANAGLIKSPEDQTVAEKLALEAKNAKDDTERWEYVRTGLRDFNQARETIRREIGAQDPAAQGIRKITGDYKTKEKAISDIQPQIKKFKKYGLFNEIRNFLTDEVGLGSEDAESAIFPLEGEAKKGLDSFMPNPNKQGFNRAFTGTPMAGGDRKPFPGSENKLSPENFDKFKEGLAEYIKKNPAINLVSLRAKLNQDKRYDWQDISTAINQLIEEKRFVPDYIQDQQLPVIEQAPLPGFMQIFKYYLQGTK